MPGRIRDEDIALVRERSAVEEVVGEYLQLRNAGGCSLKALCPFHDEKTPSFNVTPARGLWYCFSCSEGGDVISFVQKIDSLSFTEAVERLAARAGIDLRYEQGGQVPDRSRASGAGSSRRTRRRQISIQNGSCPPMPSRRADSCPSAASRPPTGGGSAWVTRQPSGTR